MFETHKRTFGNGIRKRGIVYSDQYVEFKYRCRLLSELTVSFETVIWS